MGSQVFVSRSDAQPRCVAPESVKFGRFAIRAKARNRIERATHGAAHYLGTWLEVDGRVLLRGEPLTPEQLESAYVRLGWGPLHEASTARFSQTAFSALVPYRATSAEIETGWMIVADLVCGERWEP